MYDKYFTTKKLTYMRVFKILILIMAMAMIGCEKTEEINNTEDRIGASRVTRFPSFTMNGDRYMSIVVGQTFTDPGVTAKEGTTDLAVQTAGTVDASTVGFYDIVYTATNKDGFSSSVTRTIAVLPAAEQPGANISGSYANTGSFAYTAVMQKLAPGFYVVDNVWGGGSAAVIAAYVISLDGQNLLLPVSEISPYGRLQGTGVYDPGTGNLTYTISLLDLGVSNSVRKWKKV